MNAPHPHPNPLKLAAWDDPYTLGAFAAKARIPITTVALPRYLRNQTDSRTRQYHRGIAEADQIPWCDLAYEMLTLSRRQPAEWSALLLALDGVVAAVIRAVIQTAHDWETAQQIRIGAEIASMHKRGRT